MKTLSVMALVGLGLVGAVNSAIAQRGGRDYGYDEREYGSRSYGERDVGRRSYDDDDDLPGEHGRSYDNDRGSERGRRYDDDQGPQRGREYDNDDRGRKRGRGSQEEPEAEFDEDEYLRCNPDVSQAVKRGEMASGYLHYRTFGRREKRQLTCPMKL